VSETVSKEKSILDVLNFGSELLVLLLVELRRETVRRGLSLDELIDSAENQTRENEDKLADLLGQITANSTR
jgi:hypothetical protein